ncbi:sugar (and other) transporter family protein [Lysobacter antibioticus]|uniref:Sugar (And other) transporter family protein n=2 Tax=Lysobacter antibioticus TaxID=84531 RepID=A0A0S2FHS5_LYSAN|nr:sugar (and other) transporter family protein [Lysobacter antibioticus]
MGSEMVHSLLPVLLAGVLGASALTIGLIEGAAEALVLVIKVFSGYLSDAIGRRKPLVLLGYGLAAAVKPLFPLADSAATVATARLLDRFGKGIRGAPRDALVGDLAPAEIRGACFGLRQSMDTVGAVVGPLLAVGLMWLFANNIQTVLWFAVIPGILAVLLLLKVPEPKDAQHRPARVPLSREGLAGLGAAFWRLAALGALISLARFSEAFLVLRASHQGLPLTFIPLVLVVMSVVYTLTAYPAGRLSDSISRPALLAIGMAVLVAADVALALANGYVFLFVGIALWGLHMGLTQGILATMIADVAPKAHRGTAFGVFNLLSGGALLVTSGLAGWLWDQYSPSAAFWMGASVAVMAVVASLHFSSRTLKAANR